MGLVSDGAAVMSWEGGVVSDGSAVMSLEGRGG